MGRTLSEADQRLLDELTGRGRSDITARQLERWRQAGVTRTIRVRGPGRGGSTSRYPDGTASHVAAFATTLAEYGSLPVAVLAHFADGHPITEAGLKDAYTEVFDTIANYDTRTDQDSQRDEDDHAWDRAERLAGSETFKRSRIGRAWRNNLRQMPDRQESIQRELWNVGATTMHTLQTGARPSAEAASSLGFAAGFGEASRDIGSPLADRLAQLSLPVLTQIVAEANLADLEQARDDARTIFTGLAQPDLPIVQPPLDRFLLAVIAPATVPLRRALGPAADHLYQTLEEENADNT